nr:MAG TPA_asm: hypothetical protein [Caudoviricetes sp.]
MKHLSTKIITAIIWALVLFVSCSMLMLGVITLYLLVFGKG